MTNIGGLLREPVVPTGELDALLSESMRLRDIGRFEPIVGNLPPVVANALRAVITRSASPEQFFGIAQFLSHGRLSASALAAIDACLYLLPWDVELYIQFFELRASIEDRSGMTKAAAGTRRCIARLQNRIDRQEALPLVLDASYSIVDAWNRPREFLELSAHHTSATLLNDPLRDPSLTKHVHHHQGVMSDNTGRTIDFSFFVVDRQRVPVLQVECDTSHILNPLRCREAPIVLTHCEGSRDAAVTATALALDQLRVIASWAGTRGIQVEIGAENAIDFPTSTIAALASRTSKMIRGSLTLDRSEEGIIASFSENHRRSLRKGMKVLDIQRFSLGDRVAMEHYRIMHAKVDRMPALDAAMLAQLVSDPRYVMYACYRDHSPVGMLIVSLHGKTAYYSAGIMVKQDNTPIGHALITRAILDCRSDGLERFDFGLLDIEPDGDTKLRDIGRFKMGFCNILYDCQVAIFPV
jgi:hypothetical protein